VNGISHVYFTLAVPRDYRNKETGEKETDFIPIVAWRQQAEVICQYLRKGSRIAVEGAVRTRNYEKNGERIYVTEVQLEQFDFLDTKKQEVSIGPKEKELVWADGQDYMPF
jgi:single-strand DNA-binding protein